MSHANAQLTPAGRLRLAQLIVEQAGPCAGAAERWNYSVATARRWTERYRATTATVRRTLVAVPARVATSARRIVLHLPRAWP